MKKLFFPLFFFLTGGSLYYLLELACRRYSHWSMFVAGGLCLTLIDVMNRRMSSKPLWFRCTLGAVIITAVEFVAGCCVNLWAHWNVWDYSHFRHQFMGQICLRYTAAWFLLSAPAIWLTSFLRRLRWPAARSFRWLTIRHRRAE